MGIFIKNPETEKAVRALAELTGESLTTAIEVAVRERLSKTAPKPAKPTFEEMMAATRDFRKATGLDQRKLNVTKADFDALWEIPELDEDGRRS